MKILNVMNFSNNGKTLLSNIFYLFVSQGINYLLPFLTIPYLFRVLGADLYGVIASTYSYYILISIIINFGYEYYATRQISLYTDNKEEIDKIVSETIIAKMIILLICIIATIIITNIVPNFQAHKNIFYWMMGVPIGTCFFSIWFFQGIQQMKFVTIVSSTTKLLSFLPMFIFVKSESDDYIVPICYSMGFMISGGLSLYLIRFRFNVRFINVGAFRVWNSLKESSLFCLSRISASLYSTGTTVILNAICGNAISGYYDIAIKIVNVFTQLMSPINQALYPYMVKCNNTVLMKRIVKVSSACGFVLFILLQFSAPVLMQLLFNVNDAIVINTFRILNLLLLFVAPSYLMGYPLLAARGHDRLVNIAVITAAFIYVFIVGALYLFGYINIYTMSVAYLMCEFYVFATRVYGVKKYHLLKA